MSISMNELKSGQDKINEICEKIKSQTLDPAKKEAEEIIQKAKIAAAKIIKDAENEKNEILEKAYKKAKDEEKISLDATKIAAKQVIEKYKTEIEEHFFKDNLKNLLDKKLNDPEILAKFLNVLIKAIEKEGTKADFTLHISKEISKKDLCNYLLKDILKNLEENKIIQDNFSAGAIIKLHDKKITLDISSEALLEIASSYIRKDLRNQIFNL